jgi:hypothetical protein
MTKARELAELGDVVTVDSGNVGIGTSSPSEKVEILHSSDAALKWSKSGSSYSGYLYQDANGSGVFNAAGVTGEGFYLDRNSQYMYMTTAGSERARIDSSGNVLVGKTSSGGSNEGAELRENGRVFTTTDGQTPIFINRLSNDGTLITFRQADSEEGTISVSGTTVSYNGGHLSRWSQTADNTRITGLLKGTVLTNLDQMAEWTTDGVTEANEQLNCMAVSSVEGDPNVAGVFVNWDEDDEVYRNDMNVAMTGDMIIRIAQGTTVARGDLLMSAGDGTAKPQGDDIVRSKTIAKVTSTNVTCTYDDNSYCVPCVLMAC